MKHIPAPEGDPEGSLQLLISTIDYNDYVGRIGVGRIERGSITAGQMAIRCVHGSAFVSAPTRLAGLFTFDGLKRVPCEEATVGDIVAVTGFEDMTVTLGGETAAWDASISAYVSDNYKLTFDTVNNEIKFATLA
jgi:GTP-binding protein